MSDITTIVLVGLAAFVGTGLYFGSSRGAVQGGTVQAVPITVPSAFYLPHNCLSTDSPVDSVDRVSDRKVQVSLHGGSTVNIYTEGAVQPHQTA